MRHYYKFKNVLNYFQETSGIIDYKNLQEYVDDNMQLKQEDRFDNFEQIKIQQLLKETEIRRAMKKDNHNTKFAKEFLEVKN